MELIKLNDKNIIATNGNIKTFFSYDSKIMEIDTKKGSVKIGKDWNYSRTTQRFLYKFINLYIDYINNTNIYKLYLSNKKIINKKLIEELIKNKLIKEM